MTMRERKPMPRSIPGPVRARVPAKTDPQVRRVHRHPIARLKRRLARI